MAERVLKKNVFFILNLIFDLIIRYSLQQVSFSGQTDLPLLLQFFGCKCRRAPGWSANLKLSSLENSEIAGRIVEAMGPYYVTMRSVTKLWTQSAAGR